MRLSIVALAAATLLAVGATSAPAKEVHSLFTYRQSDTLHSAKGGDIQIQQTEIKATGSGHIDSFVRIRDSSSPAVQGYNTSIRSGSPAKAPLDDIDDLTFTHALNLADIPIVTLADGKQYRQFLLDINQTGSDPKLSLNQIQIFQSNSDQLHTGFDSTATSSTDAVIKFGGGVDEIYRLNDSQNNDTDLGANREIQLDFTLGSGSGAGDMFLYVLASSFNSKSKVILYSQFGTQTGAFDNNDGYEEWSTVQGNFNVVAVPAPPSAILLGAGAVILGIGRLRRRFAAKA